MKENIQAIVLLSLFLSSEKSNIATFSMTHAQCCFYFIPLAARTVIDAISGLNCLLD